MKIGVDLAKEKIDFAIKYGLSGKIEFKSISWKELDKFFKCIMTKEPIEYLIFEWTGTYTIKFYQKLMELGINDKILYIVDGYYTKQERKKYISQKKTDKIDALVLLNSWKEVENGLIKKFPKLDQTIVKLRELVIFYDAISEDIKRWKNLRENIEIESNLLEDLLNNLNQKKKIMEKEIKEIIKNSKYKELLNIPGISYISAAYIVSYIIDVNRFKNEKAFFAYVGAVKRTMSSGKYKISKRNVAFHRKLYRVLWMAVLGAIKSKKENKVKKMFFKQKNKGKHSFVARKHAMRILAYEIWKVLKKITHINKKKCE